MIFGFLLGISTRAHERLGGEIPTSISCAYFSAEAISSFNTITHSLPETCCERCGVTRALVARGAE